MNGERAEVAEMTEGSGCGSLRLGLEVRCVETDNVSGLCGVC